MSNLPPDSATQLAASEGQSAWGLTEHLLATIVDALHAANWQRGSGKGRKPRPFPRPGVQEPDRQRIGGGTSYSVAEMRDLLDANRNN